MNSYFIISTTIIFLFLSIVWSSSKWFDAIIKGFFWVQTFIGVMIILKFYVGADIVLANGVRIW
jgi:hypothetical protein